MTDDFGVRDVQVRLASAEYEALSARAGDNLQSYVRSLIRQALSKDTYPYPDTKVWHERLERVLTEGSDRDRVGIEQNLEWAVKSLPARPNRKAKAG